MRRSAFPASTELSAWLESAENSPARVEEKRNCGHQTMIMRTAMLFLIFKTTSVGPTFTFGVLDSICTTGSFTGNLPTSRSGCTAGPSVSGERSPLRQVRHRRSWRRSMPGSVTREHGGSWELLVLPNTICRSAPHLFAAIRDRPANHIRLREPIWINDRSVHPNAQPAIRRLLQSQAQLMGPEVRSQETPTRIRLNQNSGQRDYEISG